MAAPRVGSGRNLATSYNEFGAVDLPERIFYGQKPFARGTRFTLASGYAAILYISGAVCDDNEGKPRAGWACVHGLTETGQHAVLKARLERRGPFGGNIRSQDSKRAELRAAVGALRYQNWAKEGFGSIVLLTQSTYVYEGATRLAGEWARDGWPSDVSDRDLWQMLLSEIDKAVANDVRIHVWRMGGSYRGVCTVAYQAALSAARLVDCEVYTDVLIDEQP